MPSTASPTKHRRNAPGVVSLLATFVRLHAPLAADAAAAATTPVDADLPSRSKSPDVQAALTTLTRWIDPTLDPPEWLTADFSSTDLQNGNLHRCTLWHVRLRGANLTGANLSQTDLRGTDLSDAILDDPDLSSARADHTTWWPTGFEPHKHGVTDHR